MVEPSTVDIVIPPPTNSESVMEDTISVLPVRLENKIELALNEETSKEERFIVELFIVENVREETDKVDTVSVLPIRLEKKEVETMGAGPVSVENEPELILSVETTPDDTVIVLATSVE